MIKKEPPIPHDHFMDVDDEMLEYLEEQGRQCHIEINTANNIIRNKSFAIMNILIAGVGAGSLLIINSIDFPVSKFVIISFVIYWTWIALFICKKLISSIKRGCSYNSPFNLYHEEMKAYKSESKTKDMRKIELVNSSITANELAIINGQLCKYFNETIWQILATPLMVIILNHVISSLVHYLQ